MQKKILLARVAERVLVKGGKSNLMAEVKTWFLIVLSATLCASIKGWGNCMWFP